MIAGDSNSDQVAEIDARNGDMTAISNKADRPVEKNLLILSAQEAEVQNGIANGPSIRSKSEYEHRSTAINTHAIPSSHDERSNWE